MKNHYIILIVILFTPFSILAQKKDFTPQDLFKKMPDGIIETLPVFKGWIDDENFILWKKQSAGDIPQLYVHNVLTGKEQKANSVEKEIVDLTYRIKLYSKNNDLFYLLNEKEIRITNDPEQEQNPTFSPDSSYVAYTKHNDLFTYSFLTQKETQLTTDGSATILNGYASWVYYEEIFGRPTKYRAFWWSPDSKTLAYMRFNDEKVRDYPIIDYEKRSDYIEKTHYPQAGDENPQVKIGFVKPNGSPIVWADFNEYDDQYFGWPIWKSDTSVLIQWINRGQNHLMIYDVNVYNGNKKLFHEEQQPTWIDLEDDAGDRITFLNNKKGFVLKSDKTGWNHLYLHNMDGSLKNAITSGNYTVTDVKMIDEKNNIIYFIARKENSARFDLYSVNLDGKNLKRLTQGEYNNKEINISPSGKYFVTTCSNVNTPSQLILFNTKGKLIRILGNAKGAEFDNYNLAKTEYIHIKSEDGQYELPAVVTWPLNMEKGKKYPMLISIYGGPNAGTVYDSWNWTANRQWYAQEGLIQVAFDHRGSGHFGKAGVGQMHRQLGKWELADYSTMAKWFIDNGYADSTKICITGFSYGGYVTCLALTKGSNIFTHGMAGGSVTDWSLYDSHYTEKFMDLPKDNAEGYKNSSPLNYVDQYKGVLQIVHGTMDDNVHMQNSIELISKLQDKKKNFEFMLYPGGRHGWRNLPAKSDHFDKLKTQFIYKYLIRKTVPSFLL